jgi:hypothetical protein
MAKVPVEAADIDPAVGDASGDVVLCGRRSWQHERPSGQYALA